MINLKRVRGMYVFYTTTSIVNSFNLKIVVCNTTPFLTEELK